MIPSLIDFVTARSAVRQTDKVAAQAREEAKGDSPKRGKPYAEKMAKVSRVTYRHAPAHFKEFLQVKKRGRITYSPIRPSIKSPDRTQSESESESATATGDAPRAATRASSHSSKPPSLPISSSISPSLFTYPKPSNHAVPLSLHTSLFARNSVSNYFPNARPV